MHGVDLLPETGVNVPLSFDPMANLGSFKRRIGDRVCLKANIHPIDFVLFGNPESVRREVETYWLAPGAYFLAMKWLEQNYKRRDFFLWIDTLDPHEP
jgi:hypothetical protein